MEGKKNRTCAICRQTKPIQDFPEIAGKAHLLEYANICLACRAASIFRLKHEEDDEGGGGGRQLQHTRDAKQLQYEMELAAALQKELQEQNQRTHNKDVFGISQALENERKKQAAQRELLDLKEKNTQPVEDDEPNEEFALNTQNRREKVTRLFSVNRSLTGNRLATNNTKTTSQKNFGIFSHAQQQQTNTQNENTKKSNASKTLSAESSTLFAQNAAKESITDEAKRLVEAIRQGQKLFNR